MLIVLCAMNPPLVSYVMSAAAPNASSSECKPRTHEKLMQYEEFIDSKTHKQVQEAQARRKMHRPVPPAIRVPYGS
jgi:hypothetical protein